MHLPSFTYHLPGFLNKLGDPVLLYPVTFLHKLGTFTLPSFVENQVDTTKLYTVYLYSARL